MPKQPRPLAGFATKTQALTVHLTDLAHKLGPGARLPTMQQLSTDLGISVMTLNRALSELEAQGIVVRRQGSGTYVGDRIGQSTVGLVYDRDVFGAAASPFCSLLLQEAERRADENGEKFSLFVTSPGAGGLPVHEDLVEAIRARKITGLLFAGESNPAALKWLHKQKLPLVALSYAPVTTYRVKIDHAATAVQGVQALARQGCRKIGLWIPACVGIGAGPNQKSFEELDAFRAALTAEGLEYLPSRVFGLERLTAVVPDEPPQSNQQQGINAALQVFGPENRDSPSRPDGFVSLDDMMTSGALRGLSQLGLPLTGTVKIATHANRGSQMLSGYPPDLTLLEIDPKEISAAMFHLLEVLMRGEEPPMQVVSIAPRVCP